MNLCFRRTHEFDDARSGQNVAKCDEAAAAREPQGPCVLATVVLLQGAAKAANGEAEISGRVLRAEAGVPPRSGLPGRRARLGAAWAATRQKPRFSAEALSAKRLRKTHRAHTYQSGSMCLLALSGKAKACSSKDFQRPSSQRLNRHQPRPSMARAGNKCLNLHQASGHSVASPRCHSGVPAGWSACAAGAYDLALRSVHFASN